MKLTLFDTGYCLNFEKMVNVNQPWKVVRFYALVALIEHPTLGPILFDTGYSQHVTEACKRFPYFMYKLLTPIRYGKSAAERLLEYGYRAKEVRHVVISHFHADHIGGLKDFPNATFHYLPESYAAIKYLKCLQAIRQGFLPDLIPERFDQRSCAIDRAIALDYLPFNQGYDLFGDQSVIGIELPGHAKGQLGIIVRTPKETIFLVADACWTSSNYQHLEYPHRLGRLAIANYDAFCETLHKLHIFHQRFPNVKIVPTHCSEMWERECVC